MINNTGIISKICNRMSKFLWSQKCSVKVLHNHWKVFVRNFRGNWHSTWHLLRCHKTLIANSLKCLVEFSSKCNHTKFYNINVNLPLPIQSTNSIISSNCIKFPVDDSNSNTWKHIPESKVWIIKIKTMAQTILTTSRLHLCMSELYNAKKNA